MKRFKKILFVAGAADRDTVAWERAVTLAQRNAAELTIVDAIRDVPADLAAAEAPISPDRLLNLLVDEERDRLQNRVKLAADKGVNVNVKVLVGTNFVEIIREVLRGDYDLVMKTAEEPFGLRRLLFGPTGMHLMRKCPCPVWIIKAASRERYLRILAAVDPSPEDVERQELNRKVLDLASSLADLEGCELQIVHSWTLFCEDIMRGRANIPEDLVENTAKEVEQLHRRWLYELIEPYHQGDRIYAVHLLKGEPEDMIPDVARKQGIELIVMGTVCRTGLSGFLMGNTAEKILNVVNCSVLTVKPDGFKSPITLEEG